MNHSMDLMTLEQVFQSIRVADVDLFEVDAVCEGIRIMQGCWIHESDVPDPIHNMGLAVGQIICDDDIIAGSQQLHAGVGSDEAGAAGNKYYHTKLHVNEGYQFMM